MCKASSRGVSVTKTVFLSAALTASFFAGACSTTPIDASEQPHQQPVSEASSASPSTSANDAEGPCDEREDTGVDNGSVSSVSLTLDKELPDGFLWACVTKEADVLVAVKKGQIEKAKNIVGSEHDFIEAVGLTKSEVASLQGAVFDAIDAELETPGLTVAIERTSLAAEVTGGWEAESKRDISTAQAEEQMQTIITRVRKEQLARFDAAGFESEKPDSIDLSLTNDELPMGD